MRISGCYAGETTTVKLWLGWLGWVGGVTRRGRFVPSSDSERILSLHRGGSICGGTPCASSLEGEAGSDARPRFVSRPTAQPSSSPTSTKSPHSKHAHCLLASAEE